MSFLPGRSIFLVVLFSVFSQLALAASNYSAIVYERGSHRTKKLFTLDVQWEKQGDSDVAIATYKDMNGEPAVIEKSVLKGSRVEQVDFEQRQENATATITYSNDSAHFKLTENGKTQESTEEVKGDFVMPGSFQRYVASRWADLNEGKTVEFRYGVWFRRETFGFKIKKVGEEGQGADKKVLLHMKASSFFVAAMVDPVDFKFSADGSKILELNGRVAPKIKKNGKFYDLDAEMIYSYP